MHEGGKAIYNGKAVEIVRIYKAKRGKYPPKTVTLALVRPLGKQKERCRDNIQFSVKLSNLSEYNHLLLY